MLSFPGSLKVFIALDPFDMRAGINSLHALVADKLREDNRSGALFVFTNKRRRLIKVLYWDASEKLDARQLRRGAELMVRTTVVGDGEIEFNLVQLPSYQEITNWQNTYPHASKAARSSTAGAVRWWP